MPRVLASSLVLACFGLFLDAPASAVLFPGPDEFGYTGRDPFHHGGGRRRLEPILVERRQDSLLRLQSRREHGSLAAVNGGRRSSD